MGIKSPTAAVEKTFAELGGLVAIETRFGRRDGARRTAKRCTAKRCDAGRVSDHAANNYPGTPALTVRGEAV